MRRSSKRPFVAIVCAAIQNYLQNPAYYKPRLLDSTEKLKDGTTVSVVVSRRAADFFLDEAFESPIRLRARFIGLVVGFFLRRYPFEDLVTALYAYADVLVPIVRGTNHGKFLDETPTTQVSEDHQAR